eukprot:6177696-Pleurochrysis_carterae.AAC.5
MGKRIRNIVNLLAAGWSKDTVGVAIVLVGQYTEKSGRQSSKALLHQHSSCRFAHAVVPLPESYDLCAQQPV